MRDAGPGIHRGPAASATRFLTLWPGRRSIGHAMQNAPKKARSKAAKKPSPKPTKPAPAPPKATPEPKQEPWPPEDHIKCLKPDPENARKHNPRNIGVIVDSLQAVGAARSIVIDESNCILAGNGVVEAAGEAGITKLQIVEADGETVVAVRRRGLTTKQKRMLALADNRANELSEWNDAQLNELLKGLDAGDLQKLALTPVDLSKLGIEPEAGGGQDAEPQIDQAAELNKKWGVKLGDLWQIGEHRLLCGDSTKKEDVARVMNSQQADVIFTDPPYGHKNNDGDLIQNWEKALGRPETKSSAARPILNDGVEANEVVQKFFTIASDLLKPGCCCCCCCGGGGPDPQFARWSLWLDAVIPFKMCVVWDKGGLGMGWHYRRNWECILVAEKPGAKCKWYGGNDVANVIRDISKIIPSEDQHPTEKPMELAAFFLRLHSTNKDICFEPFCGSGSTMVACQNLNRICSAIEMDSAYCALTLQRMQDAFGIIGTRL